MRKNDLRNLDKDKLIGLLLSLSKLDKENNSFLKAKLFSDFSSLFKIYCKKIDKAFSCYELMNLKDGRKALNNFKKSGASGSKLVELCIYYIRRAYRLEKSDWRFQENFYSAIEKVFAKIIDILKEKPALIKEYDADMKSIIKNANEGWNHKNTLKEMYDELL